MPQTATAPARKRERERGFTLMEVIIAVALLAVVSAISWRGLAGMIGAHERINRNSQSLAVLQTSLAQWHADLNAIAEVPRLDTLDWDGKVLRITRNAPRALASEPAALQVVAWSDRDINGQRHWARWQSAPVQTRQQWRAAWQAAQQWARAAGSGAAAREVLLLPIGQWEIFYSREGAWVNPQSSAQRQGTSSGGEESANSDSAKNDALPDSVRLRLQVAPGEGISGWIGSDWLNPQQGRSRL